MCRHLCFLVTLVLQLCYCLGQDLPPVACPDNFGYLKFEDRHVGQVAVVLNSSYAENNVKVELCVRGASASAVKAVGEIKLLDTGSSLSDKLKSKEKVNFQIDLAKEVVPKLTRIVVNGETICHDEPCEIPFTSFTRKTVLRLERYITW